MHKKRRWKQGNGTTLSGLFVMLLCTSICLFFAQTFILQQESQASQTAADSISDATAVYASNEGATYDEAIEYAKDVQKLVETNTGIKTTDLTINRELYEEEHKVDVSLNVNGKYTDPLYNLNSREWKKENDRTAIYKVPGKAQTKFTGIGSGVKGVLDWALQIANDDSHWYLWGGNGPQHYDCTGFVANAYIAAGVLNERPYTRIFTTAEQPFYLLSHGFKEVTNQVNLRTGEGMLPGDVLHKRENGSGHTELYYGNGQQIGAHSTPRTIAARPGSISIVPLYGNWQRVFRYVG